MKKPFATKEKLEEIASVYPTPFHLYDERGIRENAREIYDAFSWNKGFKEYFAVKATPNPFLLRILREFGCGTDCSSMTELMLSEALGIQGHDIMFSSNDTPLEEFRKALDATYYKKRFPELAPEKLEEYYNLNLKTVIEKEARNYPHSVIVIYSYLYHKEHEVDRLTTAIECVRYGLSPAETLDYIHKT